MTDIPIIFSAPMVKAWLAGSKGMTRRLLYSKRKVKNGLIPASATELEGYPSRLGRLSAEGFPTDIAVDEYWTLSGWQRVKPGDRLWVRENFARNENQLSDDRMDTSVVYAADGKGRALDNGTEKPWTPSIHMPRWASRLTLIVGAVKIERLQDISEEDAKAEGVEPITAGQDFQGRPIKTHRTAFVQLWVSLHGVESWLESPWVVAITASKVIKANIDAAEARAA